ncbi:hypothetical protein JH146_1569 [Methanocaldococcus bathoardescens]|uniref:DUF2357 domain-containing protein n=1 Tax=Methanocaldococcus bathoardescens TaxID=1301915 RepID=A0A076LDV9_9EURY|nr:DUF2357 domain-containing protein [Methanocaldococcus bathoardescens]AIJ06411.1 hypothetical protein JH146_1569 [Methanocaldococcus bathoardescens]
MDNLYNDKLPLGNIGYISGKFIIKNRKIYFFEWVEYIIKIKDNINNVEIFFGDEKAQKIENIFRFTFKNYVGKSIIKIYRNQELIFEKPIEVVSEKFANMYKTSDDYVETIINNYEIFISSLISEISKKYLELPFSIKSPTGFEFIESDKSISEFFAYHFLKNNKEKIISSYEEILKNPHRKLIDKVEWADYWEVNEISEETIFGIIQHPEYLIKTFNPVADKFNGYFPQKLLQRKKYETFDTLENRFIKYFLNELIMWTEKTIEFLKSNFGNKKDDFIKEIINNLQELCSSLGCFRNNQIFSDVGELDRFPYTSQVLLKRYGYKDLFELWREFRTYYPIFTEIKKCIENKDIAKLYEYWCFFKLVEELGNIFGIDELKIVVEPIGDSSERSNVYAKFDNGWKLYFNKRLSPKKYSYSVSLRPDFSLFDENNNLIGVFDAKFKFDIPKFKEFDEEEKAFEKTYDFKTWAKLEDIYKIHTYRDALKVRFAVVLYPGERSVFFDVDGGRIEDFSLEKLLNEDYCGVGYIRYLPEGSNYGKNCMD